MIKKPTKTIVSRIDQRLKALASPGKKAMSDRAASLASGLSADGIRTIRRQFAAGRQKGIGSETLQKLALGLKTTPMWLLKEEGPETLSEDHIDSAAVLGFGEGGQAKFGTVRVVGYVGAGSEAHYYKYADEDFDEVPAPLGASDQTVAVEIKGKSFGPLMDSWLVFYDDVRSPVTEDLIGEVCVVGLADDRILIKEIKRERNGSYTLLSNSSEPPIPNASIEWAAKVKDMRPR